MGALHKQQPNEPLKLAPDEAGVLPCSSILQVSEVANTSARASEETLVLLAPQTPRVAQPQAQNNLFLPQQHAAPQPNSLGQAKPRSRTHPLFSLLCSALLLGCRPGTLMGLITAAELFSDLWGSRGRLRLSIASDRSLLCLGENNMASNVFMGQAGQAGLFVAPRLMPNSPSHGSYGAWLSERFQVVGVRLPNGSRRPHVYTRASAGQRGNVT